MFKIFFLLFSIAFVLTGCSPKLPAAPVSSDAASSETPAPTQELSILSDGVYTVDSSASRVQWTGKKMLIPSVHTGTIGIREGSWKIKDGRLMAGAFVLDMNSIQNEDLEGGAKTGLEQHLKSPDFFDTATYPEARLTLKSMKSMDSGFWKTDADLTLKDVTRPIEFEAKIQERNQSMKADAEFVIDRTLWGIRYASGKFFEGLGDKVIDDQIGFKVSLTANSN